MKEEKQPMALNSDIIDFTKLKEVRPDSIEAKLYILIDDIDTALDIFKPDLQGYEKYVIKKIREAHKHIVSDGYKLYYVKQHLYKAEYKEKI